MPCDCTQQSAVHAAASSALQQTLYCIALLLRQEFLCGCLVDIFALHCGPLAHADHAVVRHTYSIFISMHLFLCMNLTDLSALCFGL